MKFFTHTIKHKLDWRKVKKNGVIPDDLKESLNVIANDNAPKTDHAPAVRAMTAHTLEGALKNQATVREETRAALIENLLEKGDFTRQELEAKGTDELKQIAESVDIDNTQNPAVQAMTKHRSTNSEARLLQYPSLVDAIK